MRVQIQASYLGDQMHQDKPKDGDKFDIKIGMPKYKMGHFT